MDLHSMLIWLGIILTIVVLLGRYGKEVKESVSALFGVARFEQFAQQTQFCLQTAIASVTALNREAVKPAEPEEKRRHLDQIVGGAILSVCTLAILAFIFVVNSRTFEAMGLGSLTGLGAVSWMASVADAALFIANGILLCDLIGWTHVLPPFPKSARWLPGLLVSVSLLGGLVGVVNLNDWRMNNLDQAPGSSVQETQQPQITFGPTVSSAVRAGTRQPVSTTEEIAPGTDSTASDLNSRQSNLARWGFAGLMIAAVLTTITSATAVIVFARYVWVFATGLLLVLPAVLAFWLVPIWPHLWRNIEAAVQAGIDVGVSLCGPIVELFRVPLAYAVARWHNRCKAKDGTAPTADEAKPNDMPDQTNILPTRRPPSESPDEPGKVIDDRRAEKNGKPLSEFSFEF